MAASHADGVPKFDVQEVLDIDVARILEGHSLLWGEMVPGEVEQREPGLSQASFQLGDAQTLGIDDTRIQENERSLHGRPGNLEIAVRQAARDLRGARCTASA